MSIEPLPNTEDTPLDGGAESTESTETPRRRVGAVAMAVAASMGIAAGGGTGAWIGAPMLARRTVEPAAVPAADSSGTGDRRDAQAGPMHVLDNMVLNPAESGASRFLLISVALQLHDEAALTTLKARDAAVRDIVLRILGARRVEELSDMSQRDVLRTRIRAAIDSLSGDHVVTAVYFPQFVIQ